MYTCDTRFFFCDGFGAATSEGCLQAMTRLFLVKEDEVGNKCTVLRGEYTEMCAGGDVGTVAAWVGRSSMRFGRFSRAVLTTSG